MGLIVNTNMMALNALNDMNKNIKKNQKASEKLASGFKINRAGDDASGLAVSEKMRNKITALDTQVDTDEDAVNMIQTADGYMAEIQSMVERMVELTMKSTNGVLSDHPDRDSLQDEMDQLCGEMDRIASTANFNGIKLLCGSKTEKILETRITQYSEAIPFSNLLKDANHFNGANIDNMDEIQTVKKLSEVANRYVLSHGGNRECVNNMAVYYAAAGEPSIVASKDADINELKMQLGMNESDTLNKVETSTFGNVDAYDVMISEAGFVDNDTDGSVTVALVGAALNSFKSGYEDLNCMKGKDVFYTSDGQYSFVAPRGSSSVNIQAGFANMGAAIPVTYKSQNILLSYELPPHYQIPAGQQVSEYVDKKVNLDLKIGESSTNPDKIELEIYDFHTDHLFEPVYEDVVTGTRTVFQEVNTPPREAYASVGGTKNTQREYSYPGSSGGTRQEVLSVPVMERVNTGAATKVNEISTYRKAVAPDISTQDNANQNIDAIKKASGKIATIRGEYGAKQNRIEHTINVITTESENTKAAKSRIKDTDMAVQISQYTSQNIMTQAAQSMFAQANAKPQEVSSLLQPQG